MSHRILVVVDVANLKHLSAELQSEIDAGYIMELKTQGVCSCCGHAEPIENFINTKAINEQGRSK